MKKLALMISQTSLFRKFPVLSLNNFVQYSFDKLVLIGHPIPTIFIHILASNGFKVFFLLHNFLCTTIRLEYKTKVWYFSMHSQNYREPKQWVSMKIFLKRRMILHSIMMKHWLLDDFFHRYNLLILVSVYELFFGIKVSILKFCYGRFYRIFPILVEAYWQNIVILVFV